MAVTSNFSVASTASGGQSAAITLQRIVSVDMLRGLVMVIMALDHTRDYFSNVPFPPEDLTRTSAILFFTRFITHYCAPVFFLLAGTGAFLATARGKSIHPDLPLPVDPGPVVDVSRTHHRWVRLDVCAAVQRCINTLGSGMVDGCAVCLRAPSDSLDSGHRTDHDRVPQPA